MRSTVVQRLLDFKTSKWSTNDRVAYKKLKMITEARHYNISNTFCEERDRLNYFLTKRKISPTHKSENYKYNQERRMDEKLKDGRVR